MFSRKRNNNKYSREGQKEPKEPTLKDLQKEFRTALKAGVKGSGNQLTPVLNVLCRIPDEHHEETILQKIEKKENGLMYAFNRRCYRLFFVLLNKIDARSFLNGHDLLEQAIESRDDKHLDAVVIAYERSDVNIALPALPKKIKSLLYEGSWSQDVIARLYPHTTSYFIPRGQAKAKMFAFVCYTTFDREGAMIEGNLISKGLQECGFTVRGPLIDWTFDELILHLREHINEVKDQCSVIFVCLMSHGENGVIKDKDGRKGEINTILKELDKVKAAIPVVVLIQACQGDKEPRQHLGLNTQYRIIDGPNKDAPIPSFENRAAGQDDEQANSRSRALIPFNSHISVQRPNTMVVTATAEYHQATRIYFFKYMAHQLEQADGMTSINMMVQLCSKRMSLHRDDDCRAQAPTTYDILRQPLILPLAASYEKKQVQDPSSSGTRGEEMLALANGFRKLLLGKLKDKIRPI